MVKYLIMPLGHLRLGPHKLPRWTQTALPMELAPTETVWTWQQWRSSKNTLPPHQPSTPAPTEMASTSLACHSLLPCLCTRTLQSPSSTTTLTGAVPITSFFAETTRRMPIQPRSNSRADQPQTWRVTPAERLQLAIPEFFQRI